MTGDIFSYENYSIDHLRKVGYEYFLLTCSTFRPFKGQINGAGNIVTTFSHTDPKQKQLLSSFISHENVSILLIQKIIIQICYEK